jgi:hypothetical protein
MIIETQNIDNPFINFGLNQIELTAPENTDVFIYLDKKITAKEFRFYPESLQKVNDFTYKLNESAGTYSIIIGNSNQINLTLI